MSRRRGAIGPRSPTYRAVSPRGDTLDEVSHNLIEAISWLLEIAA